MKEIFVIYDESGFITSCGKVDKEQDNDKRDGSTKTEYVERKLLENPSLGVLYSSDGDLPDLEKHKIVDGEISNLTAEDLAAIEATKPKSEIDLLKERIEALEAQ